MNIIPHNHINVQVGISKKVEKNRLISDTDQILTYGLSEIQRQAYLLYDAGLNVLPQPIGQKGGYPWKRLQYSRLNRNDKSYGLNNLFAGRCNIAVMCGATSGNLFVIDCESTDSFVFHLSQLKTRKIPIWAVRTARGGHIYLRAKNGEVHNIETGILEDAEIKGCNGYVLAPPSIHPSGTRYEWLRRDSDNVPEIHTNEIDWLKNKHNHQVTLTTTPPPKGKTGNWSMHVISPASNLSRQTTDYLNAGSHINEGNRNRRLFSAACDLYGNKYSHTETTHILTPIAVMSGLSTQEVKNTINSAYSKSRTPARPTQTTLHLTWRYALLWATQQDWHGRSGVSDRGMVIALIERARVSSNENDVFRASIRELSELSKLGTTTVQRSLERLLNNQVIFNCGYDQTSKASLWRFTDKIISIAKQIELNMNTVCIPPHWLRYSESVLNSDLVERGALGHSVLFVYQYMRLLEKPKMPREMADELGISVNQINYALRKLKENELVRRTQNGWYLKHLTVAEVEKVFPDVQGKGEARIQRYQEERQKFAGYILLKARLFSEGQQFMDAIAEAHKQKNAYQQALCDPLVQFGLELGGQLRL